MAKDAREFSKNHTRESFIADRQCQYAVIRCLEVIGEVSKRLSPEMRNKVRIDRNDPLWLECGTCSSIPMGKWTSTNAGTP
ncbi:MAG: HepT-like ribonuclease domain-containing protein [Methanomicrobiales archaeon]